MRRYTEKISLFLVLALIFLTGCSTSEVAKVNNVAHIQWSSYTDKMSRVIAKESQRNLHKRKEDYKLGPDDIIEVSIFEWEVSNENKKVEVRVSEEGTIILPLLGVFHVSSKSIQHTIGAIEQRLKERKILSVPQVSVRIKEFRSKKISIVGAVKDPGLFYLRRNVTTLLDVLSLAGGVRDDAGYIIYVLKKTPKDKKQKITIDMYELIELGNLELNVVLEHNDVVYVPKAQEFAVSGFVNKADSFPIKKPTTVLDAVAMAGGLNEEQASPEYCLLKRRDKNGNEEIVQVDLLAIAERRKPNIFLKANDVLIVRQTTVKYVYNQFARFFRFSLSSNVLDLTQ